MNRRVELKLQYSDGKIINIVAEQGVIPNKPAMWKLWRIVKTIVDGEVMWEKEVSDTMRREIAQYFGINYK